MSRDLRQYAKQTNVRLFIGFLFLLFIIGDGLVYVFFGTEAAISGLVCIFAGLFPLVLIWLLLIIIDWIAKRADSQ